MSVKKESSGRRSIEVEVEVPGTPEEVWQAIATGPGVSSWFVPVEMEEGQDGAPTRVITRFGPGMDSVATQTAWEPPHRFAAESQDLGPNAPLLATEWTVEARSGGTCIVRVVHSLFASTDDWDNQLESVESGWPGFFIILRLYLTHFRGERSASIRLMGVAPEPESGAWDLLTSSLGIVGATVGQRMRALPDAPPFAGIVERTGNSKHPHTLFLRLDEPLPGIASLGAHAMCGKVYVLISVYLYGEQAAATAARVEPVWQAWLTRHFPSAEPVAS